MKVMKRLMGIAALTILTACDYAVRNDIRSERDDRVYRAAMDDYRAGRMDAAIAGLEKAVRNDPSNASARFQLACLQQDLKKDFLSAYCGYHEFLIQQPECDRAKLARERLAVCEMEAARALASKYNLNSSDAVARELDAVRAELKSTKARIPEIEKDLAASKDQVRTLSADRDRLRAVIRGEVGAEEEKPGAIVNEKDLLEEEDANEDDAELDALKEAARIEDGDETSTGSSLIPVHREKSESVVSVKKEKTPPKKGPDRPKTYIVEEGDTLYGVAKRFYGSIQAWKAIREANKALISTDNRLRAGDTIVLP